MGVDGAEATPLLGFGFKSERREDDLGCQTNGAFAKGRHRLARGYAGTLRSAAPNHGPLEFRRTHPLGSARGRAFVGLAHGMRAIHRRQMRRRDGLFHARQPPVRHLATRRILHDIRLLAQLMSEQFGVRGGAGERPRVRV